MAEKEESKVVERIHLMLEEAKRILEEARREASELKANRKAKRNMGREDSSDSSYPKKEKMLNIRIAKELEEKIRKEAKKRKMPVSALVRNVLEDVFNLALSEHLQREKEIEKKLEWY